MKKIVLTLALAIMSVAAFAASHTKNVAACSKAENIVGNYFIDYKGQQSKVKFFEAGDGTYKCQIYWVPNPYDKNGKIALDVNNPDKSLRSKPACEAVLIWNLKYDAKNKEWNGGTIYDPTHGITARCTCTFVDDGKTIQIFGNVLGIGKSVYWRKIDK